MSVGIKATHLTLEVPLFVQRERAISGWSGIFMGAAFDPPKRHTARLLDDISFDIREGDRLAILGRNGAGKSTLLRVLNQVYQPTCGTLEVQGSCQALLNLGLGFNNEATVRENVFLRGIAMGLKTKFLKSQLDGILEFSGLREKASHRLHTLSSGQRMRLGFAISTSIQHDIMLMDEWVGAGDAEFMGRAKERMQSRVGGSKIVVLASHSVGLLRDVCNKGMLLDKGRLLFQGGIVPALKAYHELLAGNLPAEPGAAESPRAQMSYGCVEEVAVEPGVLTVRGWSVASDGSVPQGLLLVLAGMRHSPAAVDRIPRKDVANHLGLRNDACGFLARFSIDGLKTIENVDTDFQVFAGPTPAEASFTLRIAEAVKGQLRSDAARLP